MSGTYAASFPIVNHAFPPERRAVGLSMWAAGFLLGNVIGAPLAGWLSAAFSWRWLFWLNLPLLAVALAFTLFAVRESRDPSASRTIDWFGVITPALGVLSLLFALQSGNELGWGSPPVVSAFAAAVVLLAAFAVYEPRRHEPLIDFGLFRNRTYWSATGVAFTGNFGFAALLFFTPMYLQTAREFTPTAAGGVLLAFSIPCFALSIGAGKFCDRFSARTAMIAGMLLLTAGVTAYATVNASTGLALVVPALVIAGAGTAGGFNGSNISGVAAVVEEKAGGASGVLSQIRLLGQAVGVAVPLVVFNGWAERRLNDLSPGTSLTGRQIHDVHVVLAGSENAEKTLSHDTPSVARVIEQVVAKVFVAGLRPTLIVVAAVCLLGVVAAALTPQVRRSREPESEHETVAGRG
jgi:predicted MFS family arabinose efflux permease